MDLHVFPFPIPPPTSRSIPSLWVFPVHQPWALVSCIQPGLVICFSGDVFQLLCIWENSNKPQEKQRLIMALNLKGWDAFPFLDVKASDSELIRKALQVILHMISHVHYFSLQAISHTLGSPTLRPWTGTSHQISSSIILEIKCTINIIHLDHSETTSSPPVHGKIVFHETGPWCQKCWGSLSYRIRVISLKHKLNHITLRRTFQWFHSVLV